MSGALLDTLLDRTVVGGYANLGYLLRSRGWDEPPRMDGKTVAVTGASSGIGLAAARRFAELGAGIWLVVRDLGRGEAARQTILASGASAEVRVACCDVSNLASVRSFAAELQARSPRLDVLVHNAGVLTQERQLSADGIELTLATNVVGPFLMTNLLMAMLERSAPSRVINVSSGGMYTQRLRIEDLQSERGEFHGPTAYARTKRAQVILTELWAERLRGTGVVVHAMHPGWVRTPGVSFSLPRFDRLARPLLRTPAQGADTIVWLAAAPEAAASSGEFWHDRRRRPTHLLARTRESERERGQLWEACVSLSGWREVAADSHAEDIHTDT